MTLTLPERIITELHKLDEEDGTADHRDAVLALVAQLETSTGPFTGPIHRQMAIALLLGFSIGRIATLEESVDELRVEMAGGAK